MSSPHYQQEALNFHCNDFLSNNERTYRKLTVLPLASFFCFHDSLNTVWCKCNSLYCIRAYSKPEQIYCYFNFLLKDVYK